MTPSRNGVATFAFCPVCNVDFSVAGGGVHEVQRHCSSAKHKSFLDGVLAQPCITSVLQKINHVVICPKKACGLRFTHKFGVIMRSRKTKEIQGKQRVLSRKHASQGW